jgi:hypothetical protein
MREFSRPPLSLLLDLRTAVDELQVAVAVEYCGRPVGR